MSDNLLPCPFCGGEAHPMLVVTNGWVRVGCIRCGLGSDEVADPDIAARDQPEWAHQHAEAIAAWNRRTGIEGMVPEETKRELATLKNVHLLLQRWEEVATNFVPPGESLDTAKHNIKELRDTLEGRSPWLSDIN